MTPNNRTDNDSAEHSMTQGDRRSLALRLSCFYAAMFSVIGIQLPFWPLYLNGKGLSPAEIGQLMAAAFFVKIITNPVVGHVVDRRGERRRPLLMLATAAIGVSFLFFPASGFSGLLIVTLLTAATFSALMPLGDSLTMQTTVAHALDYGRIRLWGSLAFIATATLGGWILVEAPRSAILWACIVGQGLTLWAVHRLPDIRRPKKAGEPHPSIRPLLTDRRFQLFLAATSLTQVSHMIYYGFATLYWQSCGLPGWIIGGLWAEGVIAEVLLFAFGNKIVGIFGPARLIMMGAMAGIVRWAVLSLTIDPIWLASVQFLHAFTFGATHLGAMHFINRNSPPALSGRAQGIYASVANGVVPGLAMLAAGRLYQSYAGHSFWAMSLIAAIGYGLAFRLKSQTTQPASQD